MGKTVGAANVKIMPNTKEFRHKLEAYLNRIEDTLTAHIGAEVKERELIMSAQKAVKAAEAAVKDFKVGAEVNSAHMVEQARRAKNKAENALDHIKADIDVNNNRFLMAVKATVKAAGRPDIHAQLKLDTKAFYAALATAKVASRFFGGHLLTNLRMIPQMMGTIAVATVGLAGMAPTFAAAATATWGFVAALGSLAGAMAPGFFTGAAMAIGVLKSAFKGMGEALKAESAEDFSNAISKMPPAAQEAATAMRGLKESFSGLGEEVQQSFWANLSNIGDLKNLVEPVRSAITGLAMDMGNAAAGVVAFVSNGQGLKMTTSLLENSSRAAGNLVQAIAGSVPGIVALGAAGAPILERMTGHISSMAEAWSNKLVAGFESGELEASLNASIAKVQEFWGVMQQLGGITSGVWSAMSTAGAPFLGTLGQVIEHTNQWVNSAQGMQTLVSFFEAMSGAVGAVLPIVGQLAGIIGQTLAPAIADFIQAIGPGLSTFVDALGSGLQQIAPVMGPLGAAFGAILSAVSPLLPAIGQIAGVIGGALASAMQAVAPYLETFANALSSMAPVVAAAAGAFALFRPVVGIVQGVGTALGLLTSPVGLVVAGIGLLMAAFTQIPGAMDGIMGAFMGVVQAIQPLFPVLQQVASQIMAALMPAITALVPVVIQIIQVIAQIVAAAMPIITVILQLAATIISALMPVITALMPAISALVAIIGSIVMALAPVLQVVANVAAAFLSLVAVILGFVGSVLAAIVSFVASVIAGFVNMVASVIAAITGFVSGVSNAISGMVNSVINFFTGMWNRAVAIFSAGVSQAVSWVGRLPGMAMSALGNLGGLLVASGRALIQGFISGITSMIGAVISAVGRVVQAARNLFPFSPAKEGPFSGRGWVLYSGRSVGAAFAAGIEDTTGQAVQASYRMAKAVQGNLDGYQADVSTIASRGSGHGFDAQNSGGITVGTIVAADPTRPIRELELLDLKRRIREGEK
ncbi:hypothetical protein GP475_08750 [Corynebacterium poyangense]|uniref:Tape measure protein n=1 Tax=Corynebacterium poyangense TaxID=2684405 RepID=A0A7H0SQ90_9CORY|nr:hypothetical protein [Corynebacterium poyangense]QNQ90715.1 hypothetical protein GP475_08750 [Corynebacterium poyangense]